MKKYIFVFILAFLCIMPLSALAQEQFFYPFETSEDAKMWTGCEFDSSNYFDYGYSVFVSNPFGDTSSGKATHVMDYSPTISLKGGKVYTLKGIIFDPLSSSSPSPRANATRSPGSNTVIVEISGAGDDWAEFSTTFFAGESGEYNLSLHFIGIDADFGVFVDELILSETPCVLSELKIRGSTQLTIPASGNIKSYYRPYILSSDNQRIDILTSSNIHFSLQETQGVSFNHRNQELTVTSEAESGSIIALSCTVKNYASLTPTSLKIRLTDNIFTTDFSSGQNTEWEGSSDISIMTEQENTYLSVPTNDYGNFGYFSTITHSSSHVFLKDVMYVLRARVKSNNPEAFAAIHATNSAHLKDNTVFFNIKDISGKDWIDVFSAFVPEQSGVYNIALNLCSAYDCIVYADDISLRVESLKAEYVTLHAPGNITIPNKPTKYPVSALLRDQLGNEIDSATVWLSLSDSDRKIEFDETSGEITVFPDTPAGTYTLTATYSENSRISAQLDITISHNYIGDGTFEETVPNQWWMVTSPFPTDFYMRNDGSSMRGLINCKGNYFVLLNNSYVHLLQGLPYVFSSAFSSAVDCTATLFLEKLDSGIIPLAQTYIEAGTTFNTTRTPELFLAEDDAIGRLFLYFEAPERSSFSIYTDNLSMKNASIVAVSPHLKGIPYVNGAVEADFTLYNSIMENTDKSACAVNWFVSDTKNGTYTELETSGRNIYFDVTFLNKYVYFEVTPICPVTGFSGTTIRSLPFFVTYNPDENLSVLPIFTPVLKSNIPEDVYFKDTQNHWGRKYIDILAYNGVVSGKSEDIFEPDTYITRAEFSQMLALSFSVNTSQNITPFTDVSPNSPYSRYINSLYLSGIVSGTKPDFFSPEKFLSREEAAVMIMRIYDKAKAEKGKAESVYFLDIDDVSSWAYDSVKRAAALGIINGSVSGKFYPRKNLTRAEAAAVIYRLAKQL